MKRRRDRDTTHRERATQGGRDWREAPASQGMPVAADDTRSYKSQEGSSPGAFSRITALWTFVCQISSLQCVRGHICVVLSHSVCGSSSQQPQGISVGLGRFMLFNTCSIKRPKVLSLFLDRGEQHRLESYLCLNKNLIFAIY